MSQYGKCLLIVDDEDDVCQVVRGKFEQLGYKVLVAHSVAEGFQKTQKEKPDCVLLDNCIPGSEGGFSFLRRLRYYTHDDFYEQSRIRSTPVIVITGAGAELQPLFEMEKISAFVEKPFDLADLQTKVEQAIRTR